MATHLKRKTLYYEDDENPTVESMNEKYESLIKPWLSITEQDILDKLDEFQSQRNITRDDISDWLNSKSDDFERFRNVLHRYVSNWNSLTRSLQSQNVQAQTSMNANETRTQSLRDELRDLSDILRRKDIEFNETKSDYEKHISLLESALAQSQPHSHAADTLKKLNALERGGGDELAQLQMELQSHVRETQEYRLKSDAMQRNLSIMRKNASELQRQTLELSDEMRRKDSEIMKLRFTVQDLTMERNQLEHKIREYNNGFISKTPNRDDPYTLDLSEFMDDEDVPADPATRGLMELDLASDTDIAPQTQDALRSAITAAKEVTDFAKERDAAARRLEAEMANGGGGGARKGGSSGGGSGSYVRKSYPPGVEEFLLKPFPSNLDGLSHDLDRAKQIIRDLHDSGSFELAMDKIQRARIPNPEILTKKLGGFEAMRAFDANERDYKQSIFSVFPKHVQQQIESSIGNLKEDLMLGILVHKIRELESTMPYEVTTKLAVLGSLPRVITAELRQLPAERLHEYASFDKKKLLEWDCNEKPESEICKEILEQIQQIYEMVQNWDARTIPDIQYLPITHDPKVGNRFFISLQRALVSSVRKFVLFSIENEKLRKELYWTYGQLQAKQDINTLRSKTYGISADTNDDGRNDIRRDDDGGAHDDGDGENKTHHKKKASALESIDLDFQKFTEALENDAEFAEELEAQKRQIELTSKKGNKSGADTKLDQEAVKSFQSSLATLRRENENFKRLLGDYDLLDGHSQSQMLYSDAKELAQTMLEQVQSNIRNLEQLSDKFDNIAQMGVGVALDSKGAIDARYLAKLERRYQQMYGLFYMKSSEVENLNDALFQAQQNAEEASEYIGELETRVRNLMSSAAQNVELRMQTIEDGELTQTFDEMMRQLRHKAENCAAAASDLYNCVEQDLVQFLPENMSHEASNQLDQYVRNIKHPCKFIQDQFNTILEEFVGVSQFVHEDRKLVEELQIKIRDLTEGTGQFDGQQHRQSDLLMPPHSIRDPVDGQQREMSQIQEFDTQHRRASMAKIHDMLEDKLHKDMKSKPKGAVSIEDWKRRQSSHRRSSLNALDVQGLKMEQTQDRLGLPVDAMFSGSRSDVPRLGDPNQKTMMTDAERARVKDLKESVLPKFMPRKKIEDTPANSPTRTPSNPGTPVRSMVEDESEMPPMDDLDAQAQKNLNNEVLEDIQSYRQKISELQDVVYHKQQLNEDLELQMEAYRQKRAAEVKNIEARLDMMKKKVREWYDSLIERVAWMEDFAMNTNQNGAHGGQNNAPASQETKDELEHLRARNEELKTQSFQSQRKVMEKKIELENLQQEFQKASMEISDLKDKLSKGRDDKREDNLEPSDEKVRKEMEKLRIANVQMTEDNNTLKNMLRDQEEEYEKEFKDFEKMANNKVADLEKFYKGAMNDLESQLQIYDSQKAALQKENTELRQQLQAVRNDTGRHGAESKEDDGDKVSRSKYEKLRKKMEKLKTFINEFVEQTEKESKKMEEQYNNKLEKQKNKTEKYEKKNEDLKYKNKELKSEVKAANREIKDLKVNNDNLKRVFEEMIHLKGIFKRVQSDAQADKDEYERQIANLTQNLHDLEQKKIEDIKQTMVEMNNLRDIIKELQRRLVRSQERIQMLTEGHSNSQSNNNIDNASVASGNSNFLSLSYWGLGR